MLQRDGAADRFPAAETAEFLTERLDKFGGAEAYNHYAVGWAHAMDTPYQWTKQVASHFGGTRNGMIVHWPKGIKAKGEIRTQFHHVIDIAPTILEAGRSAGADVCQRSAAAPDRGRQHGLLIQRRESAQSSTRRNTSRWRATAASTTRVGPPLPGTARPGRLASQAARLR